MPELYSEGDDDSCPPLETVPSQVYMCSDDELADNYSQHIVPIDSKEATLSESLIPPGTDPCRFVDSLMMSLSCSVENRYTMPTENSDEEPSNTLPSLDVTYPT
jgi:hypothetical protein